MLMRALQVATASLRFVAFVTWRVVTHPRSARSEQLKCIGDTLALRLDALGGAFAKLGQAMAVRYDVLPDEICKALERLQDQMEPMKRGEAERAIEAALGCEIADVFESFEAEPLSSATIAQVHRAVLRRSQSDVVLKVRRAGIVRRISADARLIQYAARLVPRVGALRAVALREAVELVCDSLVSQCDFDREAATQRSCSESLRFYPDVRVPTLVDDLSGDTLIVMEFIPALRRVAACPQHSAHIIRSVLRAVYFLMFCRGVVHCDLHPGNVLVDADGKAVVLDFGFAAALCEAERIAFAELFLAVAANDGATAADIVRRTAAYVPADLQTAEFECDIGQVIDAAARRLAADFSVMGFVRSLFLVQARYHIRGSRSFTMAILSLLSFEGFVRNCHPRIDFQREAIPIVLKALAPV